MKRLSILFMAILVASCFKDVPPSDVVGNWKAVHENWAIVTNGKKTTESYDYAQAPSEDFAYLMLNIRRFICFPQTLIARKRI